MREENRRLMKEIGKVVYLRATADTIYERVKEDGARPLLQCENPKERIVVLMEQRKDAYEGAADLIVDVDGKNFGQILFEIERGLRPAPRQTTPHQGQRYERSGFRREIRTERSVFGRGYTSGSLHAFNVEHSAGAEIQQADESRQPAATLKKDEAVLKQPTAMEQSGAEQAAANQTAAQQIAAQQPASEQPAAAQERRLKKLLVINGPNLNFLGIREKNIYGTKDYNYLLDMIARKGLSCKAAIDVFQSNHEGAIIDRIQAAYFDGTEGIVINPGAYTHYSYAIHDALASITVPKVEVHISNIMEREAFRHVSVTAPACDKQIYGHGLEGYLEAIDFILSDLK